MGHKRVTMERIKKDKTRLLTFTKRKANLIKKASEFSILCNVSVCVIIFPEKIEDQPLKPETWPSDPDEVRTIINRYKANEHSRKSYHVSDYFTEKRKKVDSELAKLHKQICQARFPTWDNRLDNVSEDRLRLLLAQLEAKLQVVDQKLSMMKESMHLMDEVGSRSQVVGSQLSQSLLYDLLKSSSNSLCSNDIQPISDLKPLDLQIAAAGFPQGQSSQLSMLNQNLLESSGTSNGSCTNLQVFSNPKLFNFPRPRSFPPMQEHLMKTWDNKNYNGWIGLRPHSNNPVASSGGLPHANASSGSWMWDNVSSSRPYSSMSYASPMLQSFQSQMQYPMAGLPYHPIHSSRINQFNGDLEGKEQK